MPAAERVALKKKPKARYKLKPAKEKTGAEPREKAPELSDRESSGRSPDSLPVQDREQIGDVQTDPQAPGVRNTRRRDSARTGSGKANAATEAKGSDSARESETCHAWQ